MVLFIYYDFFFCLKVTSFVSVELPESEEPKNVVRVGWSTDSESLQLGMLAMQLTSKWIQSWQYCWNVNLYCFFSDCGLLLLISGEVKMSYGYDSSGKKALDVEFTEYGQSFGVDDVIGCYLVRTCNNIYFAGKYCIFWCLCRPYFLLQAGSGDLFVV